MKRVYFFSTSRAIC